MFERYTQEARETLAVSVAAAHVFGSPEVRGEHILLSLLENDGIKLLIELSMRKRPSEKNIESLLQAVEEHVTGKETNLTRAIGFSNEARRILAWSAEEAERVQSRDIGLQHLLMGILREEHNSGAQVLFEHGVRLQDIREKFTAHSALRPSSPTSEVQALTAQL